MVVAKRILKQQEGKYELKETIMIAIAALAFMMITGIAKANKTINWFVSNEKKNLLHFIGNEVEKTKVQANSWAEMKTKSLNV